jgi:hypothetical protein
LRRDIALLEESQNAIDPSRIQFGLASLAGLAWPVRGRTNVPAD